MYGYSSFYRSTITNRYLQRIQQERILISAQFYGAVGKMPVASQGFWLRGVQTWKNEMYPVSQVNIMRRCKISYQ